MKKLNTIDKILIGCASFIAIFTIVMIVIFCCYQVVPDVLIESVFSLLGGEAVVTFFIWYIKKRYARKYEKEDREYDGLGMGEGMGESDETNP